jgi:hypothetical protein
MRLEGLAEVLRDAGGGLASLLGGLDQATGLVILFRRVLFTRTGLLGESKEVTEKLLLEPTCSIL